MYHGKLYELDMQLRPNGNSGALVTTKKEFASYQINHAWIWEHAAMIKSRAIYATADQVQWHQKLRSEVLQQPRDGQAVDSALNEMANKLERIQQQKAHHTEFKVLAEILKNSHQFPQLTNHLNLLDLRKQLIDLKLINPLNFPAIDNKKDPAS